MRNLITSVALALVASGCAPVYVVPAPADVAPLDAFILSPDHDLRFHVSRPAYAALFEIMPGSRARLLYPLREQGRVYGEVRAGAVAPEPGSRAGRVGRKVGRPAASRTAGSPRYLLLVASDHPLRLERFDRAGYGAATTVGDASASIYRPFDTMERVVELAVPPTADERSWTTDYYVQSPRRGGGAEVVVACSGHEVVVPAEYAAQVRREICAERQEGQAVAGAGSNGHSETARARRERPVPVIDRRGRAEAGRGGQQPSGRGPEARPTPRPAAGEDDGSDRAEPTRPGSRSRPASPGRPEQPTAPAAPADTARRAEPEDPSAPDSPATPAEPADPQTPAQPATPATPADPKGSGDPATPATPADPKGRGRRATPATPATPNGPGAPATPATPADPAGPNGNSGGATTPPAEGTGKGAEPGAGKGGGESKPGPRAPRPEGSKGGGSSGG